MPAQLKPVANHPTTPAETGEWETVAKPECQPPSAPSAPGEWSIDQIVKSLSRPLPASAIKQRKQGGQTIDYIPWHTVNRILDKYAIGWSFEITRIQTTNSDIFIVGRLTIPTSSGPVFREASGTEKLDCGSYGDASSNSESMAFRRCAARFGLGLYMYDKK
jgi:hypothetical protein